MFSPEPILEAVHDFPSANVIAAEEMSDCSKFHTDFERKVSVDLSKMLFKVPEATKISFPPSTVM